MPPRVPRYAKRISLPAKSLLLAATLLTGTPSIATTAADGLPPAAWLEISINGSRVGTELGLCDEQRCLLPRAALLGWRIVVPSEVPTLRIDDTDLLDLGAIPELHWQLNVSTQSLAISASGSAFEATERDLVSASAPQVDAAGLGSTLNYTVNQFRTGGEALTSAWLEWAVFGRAGVFTTTADVTSDRGGQRLDSTWTLDRPEYLQTLSVGDAISDGGQWGRSTRFAGVQLRSNFAVRPDLITFPLPDASGSSAVPATVDIYVDQILRSRTVVPAGPFEFNNLPVTSGNGEVDMVIRDAYGDERHVRMDYFVSPRLLTPGLRAYEYSLGLQREGYGNGSNYHDLLLVGTERRGINDGLTAEWHNELTSNQVRSGLGAIATAPGGGLIAVAVAGSASGEGSGWLGNANYEWRGDRLYGSAGVSYTTAGFDAATPISERTPRRRLRAALGWTLPGGSALSLSYLRQDRADNQPFEFASIGYRFDIGRIGQIQFSAARTLQPIADTTVSMHYSVRLGGANTANVDWSRNTDNEQQRLSLQRSSPALGGFGYRLSAQPGARSRVDLGLTTNQANATYTLDMSSFLGDVNYHAGVSGALAWMGGSIYASRTLYDSFALVDVDDFPGVGIYADHRLIARTNAHGRAMIPGLRAYEPNVLAIEQADLPLDARIDALEIRATPPARSGLLLHFPVHREHSAELTIVFDDGLPLPATALVTAAPADDPLPLGMDGKVLLADVKPGDLVLRVRWRSSECRVALKIPEDIPTGLDLGVTVCSGIER